MTAWQGVSQGSKYLSLTLCPLSSLLVSAIGQIKLRARRKGNCVPGHHSLPSQGTDQGGQGWMVGLEEQEMKAQQVYRVSPSLAAKNIISLISVLTIW